MVNNKFAQSYHSIYLNNVFSSFVAGIASYFKVEWYTRLNEMVISTYDKGVEHYNNRKSNAGEKIIPKYPFAIFDPGYDFEPDEPIGLAFHGYPNFDWKNAANLYTPKIYEDDNVYIAPVLNRYKGTFDLTLWCSSVYELFDWRFFTMQWFGGYNRPLYPKEINGYFVLPNELEYYSYANRYTGESYTLDWTTTNAETRLIRNINQNKLTYPYTIAPQIKLNSISDGSDKYGGDGETLGDHRMTISLDWESSIPTHLIVVHDELPPFVKTIDFNIQLGFNYVSVSDQIAGTITTPNEFFSLNASSDSTALTKIDLRHKESNNYLITAADMINITASQNFSITLIEAIPAREYIKIYGKYGLFDPDYHYKLESDLQTITFYGFNMSPMEEGDIISIEIYESIT